MISRSSNEVGPVSKKSARLPLASTSQTSVRFPCSAASRARAAATAVLPTPPLPVTKISLRSSSPMVVTAGSAAVASAGGGAEPDPALVARASNLDVGHLGGGDPDAPAPPIGQPEHPTTGGQGLLDVLGQLLHVGVVTELDLDLPRRLGDTDANVHGCRSSWSFSRGHARRLPMAGERLGLGLRLGLRRRRPLPRTVRPLLWAQSGPRATPCAHQTGTRVPRLP